MSRHQFRSNFIWSACVASKNLAHFNHNLQQGSVFDKFMSKRLAKQQSNSSVLLLPAVFVILNGQGFPLLAVKLQQVIPMFVQVKWELLQSLGQYQVSQHIGDIQVTLAMRWIRGKTIYILQSIMWCLNWCKTQFQRQCLGILLCWMTILTVDWW